MKKASQTDICFANKIVKQGNSYCIRIPKGVMQYLELNPGETVKIIVGKEE